MRKAAMLNLNDLVQSAQGGQAVDNLARRFGLSPEQAQSAINALLPAFEMGMQNKIQSGTAGAVLSHLGTAGPSNAYNDPAATQSPATVAHGGSILGSLFGGGGTTTQVAQQAAAASGLPASILQAMLPVIASMIMSGVLHSAQNGAFGGALSSILSSVLGGQQGGQGSIVGQGRGGAPTPAPMPQDQPSEGGLGGIIGSVLGGLFGGAGPQAESAPLNQGQSTPESTLQDLSRMFQAGTPSAPDHEAELANILGSR